MTNTKTFSGNTIRSIVASVFGVDSRTVTLAQGELTPFESWQNSSHDGSLGASATTYKLWGWSPDRGFVAAPDGFVGNRSGSNYAHSTSYDKPGLELHEWAGVDEFAFVLVYCEDYSNWSGSEYRFVKGYTLYKTPDFARHRANLEAQDVTRWEAWFDGQ